MFNMILNPWVNVTAAIFPNKLQLAKPTISLNINCTQKTKIAYNISLSKLKNTSITTISNLRETSKIDIYAKALIRSLAIIKALYGMLIKKRAQSNTEK